MFLHCWEPASRTTRHKHSMKRKHRLLFFCSVFILRWNGRWRNVRKKEVCRKEKTFSWFNEKTFCCFLWNVSEWELVDKLGCFSEPGSRSSKSFLLFPSSSPPSSVCPSVMASCGSRCSWQLWDLLSSRCRLPGIAFRVWRAGIWLAASVGGAVWPPAERLSGPGAVFLDEVACPLPVTLRLALVPFHVRWRERRLLTSMFACQSCRFPAVSARTNKERSEVSDFSLRVLQMSERQEFLWVAADVCPTLSTQKNHQMLGF